MSSRSGTRSILSSWRGATAKNSSICSSCAHVLRRRYATATAAATVPETNSPTPIEGDSVKHAHRLCAGVVLSRAPQITRDLHPFEKAFFVYQRRLNERLALPFTRYFYYKEKSPALLDFQKKLKDRKGTPARDIGIYNAYAKDGWADELTMGAPEVEKEHQFEALLKDERPWVEDDATGRESDLEEQKKQVRPMPRVTEADKKNDTKSLDRALQRTLYLLVKNQNGTWTFPSSPLQMEKNESFRRAAGRILDSAAGVDMNTWIISNHPIGHHNDQYAESDKKVNAEGNTQVGDMTFFMKGRIMAGQANIEKNELGVKDFQWLTAEEIKKVVTEEYWRSIDGFLPER